MSGKLYVVSTPIGNLADMTPRAVETLRSVAAILAEDTRHSRTLLDRYEIRTPVVAHHEHNEARSTVRAIERLRAGDSLALITDAGTPLVSDPGARLVAEAAAAGIAVIPIPGPSAALAALVASGLAADAFTFLGFPPRKAGARDEMLRFATSLPHPVILYESPNRVSATLQELAGLAGAGRAAAVARELTKLHEETRRGTLGELAAYYAASEPRGEVVIVIAGAPPAAVDAEELRRIAGDLRDGGASARDIARALEARGASRNAAYRMAHGDGE